MRKRIQQRLVLCGLLLASCMAWAQFGGELRFCVRAEPKTFDPLLVDDEPSDTVRYLTAGVLVRMNRVTQQLQPELALSWKVSENGQRITFKLRKNVYFSDGTPFSATDVAYTMRRLMDPNLHSSTADPFRSGPGDLDVRALASDRVAIRFPSPVAGVDRLFDQVPMMSSTSPKKEMAVLGPFYIADHKPGEYVLLKRNPNYWKHDAAARRLPYLDSVRIEVEQNRDLEMLHFVRGEVDLINSLDPEYFTKLSSQAESTAHDAGVSLDPEMMWLNQVATAPIPAYKKAWFASTTFRRALSEAINREDMARIVFRGHAQPAVGPISSANTFWFNSKLKAQSYDPQNALRDLAQDGFKLHDGTLTDRGGNPVEFSVITNSGNKYRAAMAAMMQQDLSKIGIRLNIVTLDFPSLMERLSRTFNYEACLLGLVNTELDPNVQMNVWLSSAADHQWNPQQKTPATAWEAEIDRLIRAQASTSDVRKRKQYFDRVQEIVREQNPFIYLINKDALSGVASTVRNAQPSALRPQTYWNIDELYLQPHADVARGR